MFRHVKLGADMYHVNGNPARFDNPINLVFREEKMDRISPKILKFTLAAGRRHTVGLKSDGTVTAVGDNKYGPM